MPLIHRLIQAPSEGTKRMLVRRMHVKEDAAKELNWGSVLLIQGSVVEIFEAVDVGTKAANVAAIEVMGNCPQHINAVGFIGSAADVKQVLRALECMNRGVVA